MFYHRANGAGKHLTGNVIHPGLLWSVLFATTENQFWDIRKGNSKYTVLHKQTERIRTKSVLCSESQCYSTQTHLFEGLLYAIHYFVAYREAQGSWYS